MKNTISKILIVLALSLFFFINNSYADNTSRVAQALNRAWNNTKQTGCGDQPGYYCSGVIIHTFDIDSFLSLIRRNIHSAFFDTHKPWMPSQQGIKIGKVSFSYLRRDINVANPIFIFDHMSGYIFKPLGALIDLPKYTLYCEYPVDASSNGRKDHGCGFYMNQSSVSGNVDLSTCNKMGVTTPQAYLDQKNFPENICSLSSDKQGFDLLLNIIKLQKKAQKPLGNNELVIKEWSNLQDNEVPIEAFFYLTGATRKGWPDMGKLAAYAAADLYKNDTGITIPVIAVDVNKLSAGDPAPFSPGTRMIHLCSVKWGCGGSTES